MEDLILCWKKGFFGVAPAVNEGEVPIYPEMRAAAPGGKRTRGTV